MSKKSVIVFGVFDGCDEGHQYFIREAAKHGDELVVVVARDDSVESLKNKCPLHAIDERIEAVESLGIAKHVVMGDKEQNSWEVLEKFKPDIVVLGHDQYFLGEAIENYSSSIEIHNVDTSV